MRCWASRGRVKPATAIRKGLIQDNPVRHVELPSRPRALALIWTPARVADWHATGIRPTVAVWTPAQLAAFLDSVRPDRLYALWWLAALRGLRGASLPGCAGPISTSTIGN